MSRVVRRVVGGSDRGSGTVWVLAFAAVVWLGGVAAVAVGGVRGARHQADAAADLAALAGAAHATKRAGVACARAKGIAAEYGARLSRCHVRGEIVEVAVTVEIRMSMATGALKVVSHARAGPAPSEGVPGGAKLGGRRQEREHMPLFHRLVTLATHQYVTLP